LQKLVRGFKDDPSEMWQLQADCGDPTPEELRQARERSHELRKQGELRPRRPRKRVYVDEYY